MGSNMLTTMPGTDIFYYYADSHLPSFVLFFNSRQGLTQSRVTSERIDLESVSDPLPECWVTDRAASCLLLGGIVGLLPSSSFPQS